MMRILQRLWLVVFFISPFISAYAQNTRDYPTRPVRMVVPYAPGGASDFVARIMQSKFAEYAGQHIDRLFQIALTIMRDPEVVQRVEAGGAVTSVSKSPADFTKLTAVQSERFAKVVKELGGLVNSN